MKQTYENKYYALYTILNIMIVLIIGLSHFNNSGSVTVYADSNTEIEVDQANRKKDENSSSNAIEQITESGLFKYEREYDIETLPNEKLYFEKANDDGSAWFTIKLYETGLDEFLGYCFITKEHIESANINIGELQTNDAIIAYYYDTIHYEVYEIALAN